MEKQKEENMEKFINNAPFALVLVFLVIGFVLLIKGAVFFVEGSSSVAKRLHVPSIIIGLTIVAMGTSLPETAVSVLASITGNNELAVSNVVGSNIFNLMVGNAIGSNIFNILMVLGIASVISPISMITENIIDLCVLIVFTVCVWIFAGTKKKIGRIEGLSMVVLYAAYAVYIIIR